jgi:Fe-S cluster assembly ATPase SufC
VPGSKYQASRRKQNKVVTHRVILRITKECSDRTMSEKQAAGWVEKQFSGCEYGRVEVLDVMNEEKDR